MARVCGCIRGSYMLEFSVWVVLLIDESFCSVLIAAED